MLHAIVRIAREEGVRALYSGSVRRMNVHVLLISCCSVDSPAANAGAISSCVPVTPDIQRIRTQLSVSTNICIIFVYFRFGGGHCSALQHSPSCPQRGHAQTCSQSTCCHFFYFNLFLKGFWFIFHFFYRLSGQISNAYALMASRIERFVFVFKQIHYLCSLFMQKDGAPVRKPPCCDFTHPLLPLFREKLSVLWHAREMPSGQYTILKLIIII